MDRIVKNVEDVQNVNNVKRVTHAYFSFSTFFTYFTFFAMLMLCGCGGRQVRTQVEGVAPGGGIVKVLLETGVNTFTVKTEAPFKVVDEETQAVVATGANEKMTIVFGEKGLVVAGQPVKATSLRLMSDAPWSFGNHRYRGRLLVRCSKEGQMLLVNELSIEEYLYGVVPREMSSQAPLEALKAQAVAARTYAYFRMMRSGTSYDVDTTALTQVYGGVVAERPSAVQAVNATRDQVLTYENRMAQTPYHANSGGKTEDVVNVWGFALPYLKGKELLSYCNWSPNFRWTAKMSWAKLEAALMKSGIPAKGFEGIEVVDRYWSERVKTLRILTNGEWKVVKANDFRKSLGNQFLRSTRFSVTAQADSVLFEGFGWGHGVGLCQDGAVGMAKQGASYEEILKKFYEGVTLKKIVAGS